MDRRKARRRNRQTATVFYEVAIARQDKRSEDDRLYLERNLENEMSRGRKRKDRHERQKMTDKKKRDKRHKKKNTRNQTRDSHGDETKQIDLKITNLLKELVYQTDQVVNIKKKKKRTRRHRVT